MAMLRLSVFVGLSAILPVLCFAQSSDDESAARGSAKALFEFLLTPRTDIGTDRAAQNSWLTPELKALLDRTRVRVQAARLAATVEMGPDPHEPRNSTFLNAWDSPTACEVTSGKRYKSDYLIFVYCGWGRKTNYPGSSGHYALTMKRHSDKWLVDDIRFSVNGEDESTLTRELQKIMASAKVFETSGHW